MVRVMRTQTQVNRWIALWVLSVLVLYLVWQLLAPFAELIVLGVALVAVFQPMHRRMQQALKKPGLSAAVSTLVTLLVIVVPFTWVAIMVAREVPTAVGTLRAALETIRVKWALMVNADGQLNESLKGMGLDDFLSEEKLQGLLSNGRDSLLKGALTVVGGAVGMVINFVFLVFILFFLYRDGHRLGMKFREFIPLPDRQAVALVNRTHEVLLACVYGVLMVASVQGFLGGVAFWLLGLPAPLTWGVVMALLCTLPVVGAWIVWLPAAIGLAVSGDYTRAVILLVVGQGIVSSIDGLLRPILVGQRARLHELIIFLSVLGGLRFFGLMGLLLGPALMAIAYGLVGVLWYGEVGGTGRDRDDGSEPPPPHGPSVQPLREEDLRAEELAGGR